MPKLCLTFVWVCAGQQGARLAVASASTPKVQSALGAREIPEECVLEGLEFWQAGRYGPICKGQLKKRDGASAAVVVKTLRGTQLAPPGDSLICVILPYSSLRAILRPT